MSAPMLATRPVRALALSLARRDHLTDREVALLDGLPFRLRSYPRDGEIFAAHSRPGESCLVVDGFASRMVELTDGSRQITSVQVPGDFLDLDALLLRQIDHSVVALTPCVMGFTPHGDLRHLQDRAPHLGRLLWLTTVIEAAIQRVWMGNLGRRGSVEHLGHLICELYLRLETAGMAQDFRFDFGVSQQQLSDMLGVSAAHMNRLLQSLRATGLVAWDRGRVEIADFAALARLAAFDPGYLNLVQAPR